MQRVLIFLFIFCLSFSLLSQEAPSVQTPLIIDGQEVALILISPNDNVDEIKLEKNPLFEALSYHVNAETMARLERLHGAKRFITISDLAKEGLTGRFDSSLIQVEVIIPTLLRKKTSINLMSGVHLVEKNVYFPESMSGWLNVNTTDNYLFKNGSNLHSVTTNFGLIQNVKEYSLEANTSYQNRSNETWTLGDVRLVHDSKSKLIRYTLGSMNYPTKGFQTGPVGSGVSVTKEFAISPQTIIRSLDKTTLILKRPSQVEVFLNGAQLENLRLPAGPVDLSNYPLASGENNILIKVTDDQGHVEIINSSTLFHSQLLKEGVSEFNYSLDFPQTTQGLSRRFDSNNPKASLFFNQGLTKNDTLGANFQGAKDTQLLGAENFYLSTIGLLSFQGAISFNEKQIGQAGRFEYQSLERFDNHDAPFVFRTSFEKRSETFRQVGITGNNFNEGYDFYISKHLFWSANLGGGFSLRDYRTQVDKKIGRVDYTQNFPYSIQGSLNYSQDFSGDKEKRILLTLSWTPSMSDIQSFNSYESTNKVISSQWRYQKKEGAHNMGAMLGASHSSGDDRVFAQGNYAGPLVEARVDHQRRDLRYGGLENSGQANVRFATLWTTKHFTLSRPIYDSFVVVDTRPRPQNFDLPVGQNGNFSSSVISKHFPAVISSVQPYNETNMAFDTRALPIGQTLDQEVFTVIPSYRSGVDVSIDLGTKLTIMAQIYDENSKPLELKTGRILDKEGREKGTFFSNREGRIYVEDLGEGDYNLEIDDSPYEALSLSIKKSDDSNFSDIGKLVFKRKN